MSIASVVTRGYKAGINFLPPRGYLAGNVPPVKTAQSGIARLANIQNTLTEFQIRRLQEEKQKNIEEETLLAAMANYFVYYF